MLGTSGEAHLVSEIEDPGGLKEELVTSPLLGNLSLYMVYTLGKVLEVSFQTPQSLTCLL